MGRSLFGAEELTFRDKLSLCCIYVEVGEAHQLLHIKIHATQMTHTVCGVGMFYVGLYVFITLYFVFGDGIQVFEYILIDLLWELGQNIYTYCSRECIRRTVFDENRNMLYI